jgi:hypothetical protein
MRDKRYDLKFKHDVTLFEQIAKLPATEIHELATEDVRDASTTHALHVIEMAQAIVAMGED